jgi:hypothetical protein
MNKLRELMVKATPGPSIAAIPQGTDYALWSDRFPKAIAVDKSTCIKADDMCLIAYMYNRADAIADLIDAVNGLSDALAEFGVDPKAIYEHAERIDAALAKLEK